MAINWKIAREFIRCTLVHFLPDSYTQLGAKWWPQVGDARGTFGINVLKDHLPKAGVWSADGKLLSLSMAFDSVRCTLNEVSKSELLVVVAACWLGAKIGPSELANGSTNLVARLAGSTSALLMSSNLI